MEVDLNLNAEEPPRCKHCGRTKGQHRAQTLQCPVGRGSFPDFHQTNVYEPRATRKKKAAEWKPDDVGMRGQGPSREWVDCPVCGESDMRKETDAEGNSLIFCVNHNCASNGGTNAIRLLEGLGRK